MFYQLEAAWFKILSFIDMGGPVLWVIMGVLFFMWLMIVERLWYYLISFPKLRKSFLTKWNDRDDQTSWFAKRIREQFVSEANIGLRSGLGFLDALVAISPLLGLFGTVYGMLNVFDIMAIEGTSNARAMAGGVAKATVPTMAGMIAALSGVFFTTYFKHKARTETEKLEDSMTHH
jgi:biopolymer transport protein ExbB